jgi:hypothetical protein
MYRMVLLLVLCPVVALAGNLQLPTVHLPSSEATQPSILFSPAEVATLQARRTDPAFSGYYAQVKGLVDGQLGGLKANPAGLGDDTLSKVAKGAAILHQLGETPTSQFTSYRDAAVVALKNIVTRNPSSIFGGTNAINVLQDAPRLQSMAEAYDLLHGTGISSGDDSAIRSLIGTWAEAMRNDYNIAGALGIPGHRDNWGIKGGASIITVALAMSGDSKASTWLSTGLQYVNESLAAVASDTGWYRESPHYLNYSLNDLAPTAWHVRNRTGVDWFPALRPFATTALAMRQPDGFSTPFEEGVSDVFPYDVFADRYPDIAPQLQWAWNHSPQDASAFENQALQAANRFVMNSSVPEQAPTIAATQFVGPDAHVHVLRSNWSSSSLQATMITAKDRSSSTLYTSRHNMQNPLDMTVFGAGALMLPTSGGGPQVTTSANRNYYLLASSRNVPLVAGNAPYITDETQITSDSRLDGTYLDAARTSVTSYSGASRVSRLLAMVGESAFVVVDEATGSSNIDLSIPFHGRGTFTNVGSGTALAQLQWAFQSAALDVWSVGTRPVSVVTNSGYYANVWNGEEAISAAQVKQSGSSPRLVSLIIPRAGSATRAAVQAFTSGTGLTLNDGVHVDDIGTSTDALLALSRTTDGTPTGFAIVRGTLLSFEGTTLLSANAPVTLEGSLEAGVLRLTTTRDAVQTFTLQNIPGFDLVAAGYAAFINGQPAGAAVRQAGGQLLFTSVPAAASIVVQPSLPPDLDAVSDRMIDEAQSVQLQLSGVDPDGQAVTFSMLSTPALPPGATLDATSGRFTWTPGFEAATREAPGVFTITFSVSDGFLTTSRTMVLTVLNVNRAPVFTTVDGNPVGQPGPQHLRGTVGRTLSFSVSASDPDGDPLVYGFSGDSDAVIDSASGAFSWMPVTAGTTAFSFTASDPDNAIATLSLVLDIEEPPPVDAGPSNDGGVVMPSDAGPDADAGAASDGGAPEDAGGAPDAATEADAGAVLDAGAVADAGNPVSDGGGLSDDGGDQEAAKVPVGCGCGRSAGNAVPLLLMAAFLMNRRRRRRTATW